MNLPKETGEIFDLLSKGNFISSNSSEDKVRRMYNVLEDNYEELSEYFAAINFSLEQGEEFFYFTRQEGKQDLERKIEIAYRWIDVLDFLKTYDNSFGPGARFTPADILVRLNVEAELKNKLEGLRKYAREDRHEEILRKILEMLRRESFLELENEITNSYKVLSSFKYLEQLVMSINIPDDVKNEIPQ